MILPLAITEPNSLIKISAATIPFEQAPRSHVVINIILALIGILVLVLIISCLIRISKYFMNAGKEQKLTRMELGKLAEEVKQIRQELKR